MVFPFEKIDTISPDEFEEFVMDCFSRAGWRQLHRTRVGVDSRYGDGGFDIEGWRADRKWLIEVKQRSDSKVGIDSLRQIIHAGSNNNCKNLILVTNNDFTTVVRDEAAKFSIELYDRQRLHSLYLEGKSDLGKRYKLRDYQQKIVDDFQNLVSENKTKFLLEMATGLGKTLTSASLVDNMLKIINKENPKILFVVHQKEIVRQSREAYKSYLGFTRYSYSALFDGEEIQNSNFTFSTFQTILMQKNRLLKDFFDIIIVDEAHHFAAQTFIKLNELYTPRFLIGLTATPERADGVNVKELFGGECAVLGKLDLAWALKNKKLAMPKYHVLTDDLSEEKLSSIKNGMTRSELDRSLFLNKKDDEVFKIISAQLIDSGIEKPKIIIFCKSIKHINSFLIHIPAGEATVVHSQMTRDLQNKNISEFREGSYKYILTVDMFNEGVDIPEVNGLVFLRSTSSKTIWLQQLGRGLRKTDNKNYVEVFDFVGSVERIFDIEELKKEIKRAQFKEDINNVLPEENEDIYEDSITVKYSRYAAEVNKLIEQYQFKLNSKAECIEEVRIIDLKIGHIPSPSEIVENLINININQIVTIFDNYLDMIKCIYTDHDITKNECEISDKILFALEKFINDSTEPSAELLQIETSEHEMPIASISYIKSIIALNMDKIQNGILLKKQKRLKSDTCQDKNVVNLESDMQKRIELIYKYKDLVYKIDDLKLISIESKKDIRLLFGFDRIFIDQLNKARNE